MTITNRYSMIDAFTPEEFDALYELVMFHDECPDHINPAVFNKVIEKILDVATEYNQVSKW